jgi:lysozyme family protein
MLRFLFIFLILLSTTQQFRAADFKKALELTLKNEGGYVNNSIDHGGETYRGITRHFYPKWKGWKIVDSVKLRLGYKKIINCSVKVRRTVNKSLANVQSLYPLIEKFYKKEFWDPLNLDKQEDQVLANMIFDSAVNLGIPATKKLYRNAIN